MFHFLFKYPGPVFTKGQFVLLSAWPTWLLPVLVVASVCAIAILIRWRPDEAGPVLRGWRAVAVGAMQSALVGLILLLLWEPAISVGELNSQQNIIAVVVDDSRSMNLTDSASRTREASAIAALESGLLTALERRFQTRVYALGAGLRRVDSINQIAPVEAATRIDAGLKQLVDETSDLPIGAVLLLSDGGENEAGLGLSGIGSEAIQKLRNRRLPVHTIGFGNPQPGRDIEIEDVSVAPAAVPNSRVTATITITQHGYLGQEATLSVRDGDKILAHRAIALQPDGRLQSESLLFSVGAAAAVGRDAAGVALRSFATWGTGELMKSQAGPSRSQ